MNRAPVARWRSAIKCHYEALACMAWPQSAAHGSVITILILHGNQEIKTCKCPRSLAEYLAEPEPEPPEAKP